MDTDPNAFPLYGALPPEERAALRAALDASPELRAAAADWDALGARLRADLDAALPDREALVLHALAARGEATRDALTDADRARLEASGAAGAAARHPGIAAASRRIQADADLFGALWDEAAAAPASGEAAAPEAPAARRERGPARRLAAAAPREAASGVRAPARQRPTRWLWRGASLAAVVAFGALLSFLYLRDAEFERVTAGDEGRLVAFADGSEARLASGAVMMVPREGADDARQARLVAGSALFSVERDPANPFEVQTPNADVTVLGTTFGVEITGEGAATRVVLASGSVRVAPREQPGEAVTLEPGQATRVAGLDTPEAPGATDVAADLAWTGTVYARELSAAEVARRISAATGREVTVDAALAGEPVSGAFSTADGIEAALRPLALALGADLLRTPDDGFRLAR